MTNPKVKKGDLIIVKSSAGANAIVGLICIVQTVGTNNLNVLVKDSPPGLVGGWGLNTNVDTYILADRKAQAVYIKEEIDRTKIKLDELNKEYDHLNNYETEEDFVAEKLERILKAKDKNSIAKVLKELKQSDYL